jgi:hypothetical protein
VWVKLDHLKLKQGATSGFACSGAVGQPQRPKKRRYISNADLLRMADKFRPPQAWYDLDENTY